MGRLAVAGDTAPADPPAVMFGLDPDIHENPATTSRGVEFAGPGGAVPLTTGPADRTFMDVRIKSEHDRE